MKKGLSPQAVEIIQTIIHDAMRCARHGKTEDGHALRLADRIKDEYNESEIHDAVRLMTATTLVLNAATMRNELEGLLVNDAISVLFAHVANRESR